MNVHDRTLELAAVGLDFGLSAAERRAINEHLDGCSRCRGDVAGLDDDARRIAARPLQTLAPARAVVTARGGRALGRAAGDPRCSSLPPASCCSLASPSPPAGAWWNGWTGCSAARRPRR